MYDGKSAKELLGTGIGYTYNDINILPRHISFGSDEVNLSCKLTKNITIKTPIVSSPMDTVTESKMAIAMALQGGIGFIHYNCSVNEQVEMVKEVKRFENGFITEPIVIGPKQSISEIQKLSEIYGFSGFPVTIDSKLGSKLIGILTRRDIESIIDDGIIILSNFISHLFQYKYKAITSITSNNGKRIPAAFRGLIAKDIIGTANIDIGPGKPPLDNPKTITPKDAKKRKYKSIKIKFLVHY